MRLANGTVQCDSNQPTSTQLSNYYVEVGGLLVCTAAKEHADTELSIQQIVILEKLKVSSTLVSFILGSF
jgi:hypothetical protein